MDRNEIVRRLVLNQICDDYENVDQTILTGVARDGARIGLIIGRGDIVEALSGLVADELANAYLLSSKEPFATRLERMPPLDLPEDNFRTFFYITEKGMSEHLADAQWWPLDAGE